MNKIILYNLSKKKQNIIKNYKKKFTIGYLSWKKHTIINKTLESHRKNGLFDIIPKENRIIFFQELGNTEIDIADKYECNYIGDKNNIGILKAFINLVEACQTEYFIFCENDFILLDNTNEYSIIKSFEDIEEILEENYTAQIKLSNLKNPGYLYSTPTNKEEWIYQNQDNYPYKVESFSWINEPDKFYKNILVLNKNYKWYKVNYKDQLWSNHIYACNTSYLKEIIIPILKFNYDTNNDLDTSYQGLEDTLCFPENIINKNIHIDSLINKLKERVIFSGGGNFYHNKII